MVSRSCIYGYGTNFVSALNINRAAGAARAGLRPAWGGGAGARALLVLAAHAGGMGRPARRAGPAGNAAAAEPDGRRSAAGAGRWRCAAWRRCPGSPTCSPTATGRRAHRCGPGGWRRGSSSGRSLDGGSVPDLSRFAAAFPEAGHAVVEDMHDPTTTRSRRRSRPRRRWRGSSTRACTRSPRRCATRRSCGPARSRCPGSIWACCSRCCAPSPPTWGWRRRSCGCATRSRRSSCGSTCRPTPRTAGR